MNIPVNIYFVLKTMAYRKKSGYTIFLRKLEIKEIAQLSVQGISYAIESEIADPLRVPWCMQITYNFHFIHVLFSLHTDVCFAANI